LDGTDNDLEFESCSETLGGNLGTWDCDIFGVFKLVSVTVGIDLKKKKKMLCYLLSTIVRFKKDSERDIKTAELTSFILCYFAKTYI